LEEGAAIVAAAQRDKQRQKMPFRLADWHSRYLQQARWTEPLRAHLFSRVGIGAARRILEVGCGTGAVLASIPGAENPRSLVGLDIDLERLRLAQSTAPAAGCLCGDALRLPFSGGSFDVVYSHFLFLWVGDPAAAAREMARVARRGGWVLALAEPDYGGRIDFPPALETAGRMQTESLRRQGADPDIGRRLAGLLSAAGLRILECGVLGAQADPGGAGSAGAELEQRVLRNDLGETIAESEWQSYLDADRRARESGSRILYVPTFYAAGLVP